jgi:transposase-like protein
MAPEGVPEMSKPSTRTDTADRGRFSARRKTEAVVRLLRGEDLETLSRQLGVTAATLSAWRDGFLDGGTAAMKSRPADERDEEIARLRSKVGQLTMDNELLGQKCQHLESGRPFASRRRST